MYPVNDDGGGSKHSREAPTIHQAPFSAPYVYHLICSSQPSCEQVGIAVTPRNPQHRETEKLAKVSSKTQICP